MIPTFIKVLTIVLLGVLYAPLATQAHYKPAAYVQAPMQVFNVRDFGAAGNGVSDDTAAIQRALDAVVSSGGGAVWFPLGTYLVSGPLVVSGSQDRPLAALVISGERSTIKLVANIPWDFLFVDFVKAVTVRDLNFVGMRDPNRDPKQMVIHFHSGCRDGIVSGLSFDQFANGVPIDWSGSGRAIITDNFISPNNVNGIIQSSSNGSTLIANNFVLASIWDNAIGQINLSGAQSTVSGNVIVVPSKDRGIWVGDSGRDIAIVGNVFQGQGVGKGVELNSHGQNITVTGNVFTDFAVGVTSNGQVASGIAVVGNSFRNVATPVDSQGWIASVVMGNAQ